MVDDDVVRPRAAGRPPTEDDDEDAVSRIGLWCWIGGQDPRGVRPVLIRGDARTLPLVAGCVQCVVTSPPYWGLRDYGVASQIGLEPTPDAYVASLVTVFAEVWRVLRDDGVCWLNLGDSYAADRSGTHMPAETLAGGVNGHGHDLESWRGRGTNGYARRDCTRYGLKHKDLVMIPARVAMALQAWGWYLRSDIIWAKKNCMPESVTDRPTRSHEYLFLLAKSERYYYNADAIREPLAESTLRQVEQGYDGKATKNYEGHGVQNPSAVKSRIVAKLQQTPARARPSSAPCAYCDGTGIAYDPPDQTSSVCQGCAGSGVVVGGRNKRSVWTIPTMPYAGAHFATMPEALVEPCIMAGCPLGGLVLDPFVGSGTVVSVAERLGRRGVGVDLSYQDLAWVRTRQRGLRFSPNDEVSA